MMMSKILGITRRVDMAKYLQYMLYATVCIVTLLVALLCMWWFMETPYTKEDFLVPAPFMVMVGLATDGRVYYADVDATLAPKWVYTGIGGVVTDIAGSYGILYTLSSTSLAGSQVKYGPYSSSSQKTFTSPQVLTALSVDADGKVAGINVEARSDPGRVRNANVYTFASPTAQAVEIGQTTVSTDISISGGTWFGRVWPGNLLYKNETVGTEPVQLAIPGVAAGNMAQVSYDGAVCIIETDGTLWCADSNVGNSGANWAKQGTRKFTQICLKGGRIVGIGKDGNIYLSNTYLNPTWTMLPRKEYDAAGVLEPGKPDITFKKVILMYPSLDARRKRYLGTATECNPDEQKIGAFCYQPCASGRTPVGTSCPYRRLHTPAQASCAQGYEFVDGSCYAPCPTGYTANGQLCAGATTDKGGVNATAMAPVSPAKYECHPSGAISARYVRIRPTTLVTNNKLCLSAVTVSGASGQVLSAPSRNLTSQPSTIGRMVGKNIRGAIPIRAVKTVGSLLIYVAEDSDGGGQLKMIANDPPRTSKFVPFSVGRLVSWRDSYWLGGTAVGTQATGEYMLVLAGQPVTTYATDGTCSDNPVGAKTTANGAQYCTTLGTGFRSSDKYDGESDQGAVSRSSKVYWEVDLGAVQEIKTIQITGCGNDSSIKGMQVELLYNSRLPSTTPLVIRKLGPEVTQILLFNYSTKAPGIDNRCYDTCPPINGLATADGGDMTCVSAPDGITSRSVTAPLSLPDPVCTIAKNEDGTPFSIPKTGGVIADWVIDPANPVQALSCAGFGVLTPLRRSFTYPTTTESTIVDLLQENGTPYVNPITPYMCVVYDQTACATGFTYDSPTQMCTSNETERQGPFYTGAMCFAGVPRCPRYYDQTLPGTNTDSYSGNVVNLGIEPVANPPAHTNNRCSGGIRATGGNACGQYYGDPFAGNCPYCAYDFEYRKVLRYPGQKNLYQAPKVPAAKVKKPLSRPADCKCLNGDGSINTTAYIYKNKCVQCSGAKDIFYPKGAKSTSSKWSPEKPASWMSLYYFVDGYPVAQVDPANHQYSELQDAKAGCEANVNCTGVTRTYNSRGVPYYSLRAGSPMSTADEAGGSRGSKGSFIDRTNVTPGDSSWERKEEANGRKQALEALHVDFEYSDRDIPRSFADDYFGTFPKALPPSSARLGSSSSFDLVNIMSAAVLQMQNTWSSFQNSVQRNTYYVQDGVERHLAPDKVSPENGICVGPCPNTHEFHDQIQILYSSAASSRTNSPAYILYGTTCHSNTFTRFPRPSIPANYTPQSGTACASTHTESGGSCIKQCEGDAIDNGTTCTTKPMQRNFVLPTYTCPSRLKLIDNVCVHDCGPGFTGDGDFCQPTTTTSDMPSSINCTRTDYGFTTAGVPGKVNKWLCDTMDDLSALLIDPNSDAGVTGTTSYTQPDDIVCYADDPTTKMYYCTSIPDFVKLVEDTQRTDLSTSCDTLMKSYFDLSNNLSILMGAQMSANTVIGQVNAIKATLETVITTFCETKTDDSGVATCSTLTRLLGLLDSTENSGSGGPFSSIATPVQVGVQSRDTLIAMLSRYKCCSLQPEGTTYPWCDVVPG